MSFFVIFIYFSQVKVLRKLIGLRNDRLICLAFLHTPYQNESLAAKCFEKIDKNAKCYSLSLSPTLNTG